MRRILSSNKVTPVTPVSEEEVETESYMPSSERGGGQSGNSSNGSERNGTTAPPHAAGPHLISNGTGPVAELKDEPPLPSIPLPNAANSTPPRDQGSAPSERPRSALRKDTKGARLRKAGSVVFGALPSRGAPPAKQRADKQMKKLRKHQRRLERAHKKEERYRHRIAVLEARMKAVQLRMDKLEVKPPDKEATQRALFCIPADAPWRQRLVKWVQTDQFEFFILFTILLNCVVLALEDAQNSDNYGLFVADQVFLAIFSLEALLKILAFGFIGAGPDSYILDSWNRLDFLVVVVGYASFIGGASNFTVARTLRLLRPLKTISKGPKMRVMVSSLLASMGSLVDMLFLLLFLLFIFGIIGIQLYQGKLHNRCFDQATGEIVSNTTLCSLGSTGRQCPSGQFCAVSDTNPNHDVTSFDNMLVAWITILQAISLEGWADIMYWVSETTSPWSQLYFIVLVLVGAVFIINLVVEVISSRFDQFKQLDTKKTEKHSEYVETLKRSQSALDKVRGQAAKLRKHSTARRTVHKLLHDMASPPTSARMASAPVGSGASAPQSQSSTGLVDSTPMAVSSSQAFPPHDAQSPQDQQESSDDSPLPSTPAADKSVRAGSADSLPAGVSKLSLSTLPVGVGSTAVAPIAEHKEHDVESASDDDDDEDDLFRREVSVSVSTAATSANTNTQKPLTLDDCKNNPSEVTVWDDTLKIDELQWYHTTIVLPLQWLVHHKTWRRLIVLLVVLNTVVLATEHAGQSDFFDEFQDWANFYFTQLFAVELVCMLCGLGPRLYFFDALNLLDFVIVVVGELEILISFGGNVTVLRSFRLLRVFKMLREWTALRKLMSVVMGSIKDVGNFSALVSLFIYIFTILGMQLFGDSLRGSTITRARFHNFFYSFLAVFQVLTGEGWNEIMYACIVSVGWGSALYFIALFIFGSYLVLSLFLAVLVGNFGAVSNLDGSSQADDEDIEDEKRRLQLADDMHRVYHAGCFRNQFEVIYKASSLRKLVEVEDESQPPSIDDSPREPHTHSSSPSSVPNARRLPAPHANKDAQGSTSASGTDSDDSGQEDDDAVVVTAGGRVMRTTTVHSSGSSIEMTDMAKQATVARAGSGVGVDPRTVKLPQASASMPVDLQKAVDEHEQSVQPSRVASGSEFLVRRTRATTVSVHGSVPLRHSPHVGPEVKQVDKILKLRSKSCGLLAADGALRTSMAQVMMHPVFDGIVFVAIVASCVLLALDSPDSDLDGTGSDSSLADVVLYGDIIITSAFVVEMLIKMIALGVVAHPGAYLRDAWNVLDFIIVVVSVIDVSAGGDFKFLKGFRVLRAMRPLRLLGRSSGLKSVLGSIKKSLSSMASLAVVGALFFLIFAILGVQLFKGKFRRCESDSGELFLNLNKQECLAAGQGWRNPVESNFDNVGVALLTLFEVASLEMWPVIMHRGIDATSADEAPRIDNHPEVAVFFIVFICICSFFLVSLFVGVVVDEYKRDKLEEMQKWETVSPRLNKFLQVHRLMLKVPPVVPLLPPTERVFGCDQESTCGRWLCSWCHKPSHAQADDDNYDYAAAMTASPSSMNSKRVRAALTSSPSTLVPGRSRHIQPQLSDANHWDTYSSSLPREVTEGMFTGRHAVEYLRHTATAQHNSRYNLRDESLPELSRSDTSKAPRPSIVALEPDKAPTSLEIRIRQRAFVLVTHVYFEWVIALLIVANILIMSLDYYGASERYRFVLNVLNRAFAGLFGLEMLVKWLGVGWPQYFADSWNHVDCGLVAISVVNTVFESEADSLGIDPTIFRAFRIIRIFRLLNRAEGLKAMVQALLDSLPALSNIAMAMFLVFFIYALAGMALFGDVRTDQEFITENANFRNFPNAIVTLFRCSTGENWNGIMHDCAVQPPRCTAGKDCGSLYLSTIFFISFVMLNAWLMLKLFVAVVFKNFSSAEDMSSDDDDWLLSARDGQADREPVPVTLEHMEEYSFKWARFSNKHWLAVESVPSLMNSLKSPLGVGDFKLQGADTIRMLRRLQVPQHKGKVHYLDLLYSLCSRACTGYLRGLNPISDIPPQNEVLLGVQEDAVLQYPELAKHSSYQYDAAAVYAKGVVWFYWQQAKWRRARGHRKRHSTFSLRKPASPSSLGGDQ